MNLEHKWAENNCTFIKTWSISIKENRYIYYNNLDKFIPKEWRFLLTSDGSLTRHLNILQKKKSYLKLIVNERTAIQDRKYYLINKSNRTTREVFLMNKNKALIFAQSYWLEPQQSLPFKLHEPIGQILIDNEINVHRELTHLYCGYCRTIESEFKNTGPLWGRSYLLYFNHAPTLMMHEIFSPYLVQGIQISQQ